MKHHKIRGLLVFIAVLLMLPGVAQAQSNPSSQQIDEYFGRLVEERAFSGSVLIIQDGETILDEGYGLANDDASVAVTPDTVFDIGSISKQFTATAILHLQASGLVDVEDTISQYLENVPDDKADITLHQLLTHSSGLSEHSQDDLEPLSRDEALKNIFEKKLLFQPGTDYRYSNSGYTLLAIIIEEVSGEPYQTYLRDNLFAPAKLESTGFYNDAQWEDRIVANGYANDEDNGSPATWAGPYWGVLGNGGILSTTGDLYRWWQALQSNEILPEHTTELLFKEYVQEGEDPTYYGYGWSIGETEYGEYIRHDGGGIGGNSAFTVYPEENLIIIILSNRIVYKEVFGVVCRAELPATQGSEQLAANLLSGDFSTLPQTTLAIC